MGATVTEVASSPVPMLSQPDVVLGAIRKAAAAVSNGLRMTVFNRTFHRSFFNFDIRSAYSTRNARSE